MPIINGKVKVFPMCFIYSVVEGCTVSGSRFCLVGSTKVNAREFFCSLKSSLVLKIKNTWLILLSHLFFYHFASMLYESLLIGTRMIKYDAN